MKNITPEHAILHRNFVHYGTNAKEWMRKCVLLLPEIARHRIWEKKGFGSIYEYAAKLAGMSRNTVDDALRILHKIEDKPALQKVVEEKGINAVRPVVAITTTETEQFWAEKATIMSKHTLQAYVQEFVAQKLLHTEESSRPGTGNTSENHHQQAIENISNDAMLPLAIEVVSPPQKTIILQLDPDLAAQLEKLKGTNDWNTLIKQLLETREAHLEEQKPAPVTTTSRHIPSKIQRYTRAKTNNACAFPRCTKPSKILHHTQRFALEKIHDPDRLEPLCKEHERMAHLGLIEHEEQASRNWKIRTQPDVHHSKYAVDQLVWKYRAGK